MGIVFVFISLVCGCSLFRVDAPGQLLVSSLTRSIAIELQTGEYDTLCAGNMDFALNFYRSNKEGSENLFFSPYSISLAFAMTYTGSKNETEKQISNTMCFRLPQSRLHPTFNYLDANLMRKTNTNYILRIVNATWGQLGYDFKQTFLDGLAQNYGVGMRAVDFAKDPNTVRENINKWVAQETENKILNLIPDGAISSATRLVLVNAIYFYADWVNQFKKDRTTQASFTNIGGDVATVSMMHQTAVYGYTASNGQYQAIEMLYKGKDISMVAILPVAGTEAAFHQFESVWLKRTQLMSIVSMLSQQQVELTLPKFKIEWGGSIVSTLKKLGMTNAFDTQADFSGIDGTTQLYISDALHKAYISVDEKGTEAAAATAVIMDLTSAPIVDTTMVLNRPFIFLIRERSSGTILFIGRTMKL